MHATISKYGSAAGAAVAIVSLWSLLGMPIPATKADVLLMIAQADERINSLEEQQLDTAIAVLSQQIDSLTLRLASLADQGDTPFVREQRIIIARQMEEARIALDRARARKIELAQ